MSLSLVADTLKKYINPVFVETGTFKGGGVLIALEAGFERIHTIDISRHQIFDAMATIGPSGKVAYYLGDTSKVLWDIIKGIRDRTTFWLDAHDVGEGGGFPLLEELRIISEHPINTHTILLDDLQWINDPNTRPNVFDKVIWPTEQEIRDMILSINPLYKFRHEPQSSPMGSGHPEGILAAFIED